MSATLAWSTVAGSVGCRGPGWRESSLWASLWLERVNCVCGWRPLHDIEACAQARTAEEERLEQERRARLERKRRMMSRMHESRIGAGASASADGGSALGAGIDDRRRVRAARHGVQSGGGGACGDGSDDDVLALDWGSDLRSDQLQQDADLAGGDGAKAAGARVLHSRRGVDGKGGFAALFEGEADAAAAVRLAEQRDALARDPLNLQILYSFWRQLLRSGRDADWVSLSNASRAI